MSDDLTNRGMPDRIRININEPYEVQYWTKKWAISQQQLIDAVRRHGVIVADVARALGKQP